MYGDQQREIVFGYWDLKGKKSLEDGDERST